MSEFKKLDPDEPYVFDGYSEKRPYGSGVYMPMGGMICFIALCMLFALTTTDESYVIIILWSTFALFFGIGAVFFICGIVSQIREKELFRFVKEMAKSGLVTEGTIARHEQYTVRGRHHVSRRIMVYYTSIDDKGEIRKDKVSPTDQSNISPVGQSVPIIFYQGRSYILKRYSLLDDYF